MMCNDFINMENCRVLAHDNNGPEIRFIDDKTGKVYYKKLTDQECMDIAHYFNKLVGDYVK